MSLRQESKWRRHARALIEQLTRDLPADASLAERRAALWGKGAPAHLGTRWGRKMWGKEVRAYLARHGDMPAAGAGPLFTWPEHVHFPFRGERSDA